jgi:DNA polymerase IV
MDRSIIHLNVADFAAAVERLLDRRLAGRPLIIAPEAAPRATVYDMSDEAYQAGVRKGMPLRRATRLCRDAPILSPHPQRYEQAMAELLRQGLPYSPLIEPGECDGHLFVDVSRTSRLFGPPVDVAWRLRRQIHTHLGLDPIWTVAANKLVAKVASRLVKPLGEYIVAAGDEEALLAPLPLSLIPGFEMPDLVRLSELNLKRVDQLRQLQPDHLTLLFGRRAAFLGEVLRGLDHAPVLPAGSQPPRVALDHTFGTDTHVPAQVEGALFILLEHAARRLRRQGRAARQVVVTVTHSDGRRYIRQVAVAPPTANDLALFPLARKALHMAWTRRARVRHLRLACERLVYPPTQQPLFAEEAHIQSRHTHLVAAMDRVRERYGSSAVQTGRGMAVSV